MAPQVTPTTDEKPLPWAEIDVASLSRPALVALCKDAGLPAFRAEQLFRWLHVRQARSWDAMTDLPASWRTQLATAKALPQLTVEAAPRSQIDGSWKLVLRTQAGHAIETVVMPMEAGVTQCISSQVGCKMGCDFCATARIPERANLTAGEIVEQVAVACRLLVEAGLSRGGVAGGAEGPLSGRPHNLVYMGMGEPLDNLAQVIASLDILTDPKGYDFSPRRITVSTSGLAKYVPQLVAAHPHVNLAWSLTATTDAVRDRLMPVNRGVPIQRMVDTLRNLPPSPHRKLTFEYALLKGVNDSLDDAKRLAQMARDCGAHCNVIPFNAWPGADYQRPERAVVARFFAVVQGEGASVSLRESKGQDIGAACGQLAGKSV